MPAAYGWARTYRSWLVSIRIGPEPVNQNPAQGLRCDFCARMTTAPDAALALLDKSLLPKFEQAANLSPLFPPSRKWHDGTDRWVACALCMTRFAKGLEAQAG
jgi:hypothetical protein